MMAQRCSERALASEPRARSAPAKRRARARVGESEGRSPSDKKMRVLHVTQGYWPAMGGTELVIQRVSEELVSRFHDEVTVFTTDCFSGEAFFNRHLPRMPVGWEEHHGVRIRRFHVESRLSGIVRRLHGPAWRYRLPGNEYLRTLAQGPRIRGLRHEIAAFPS